MEPLSNPTPDSSPLPSLNTRPHKCHFCRKGFTKPEHLCRHIRIHTGLRPFECSKCQKRFSRQDTLARHMRLHSRRENGGKGPLPERNPPIVEDTASNHLQGAANDFELPAVDELDFSSIDTLAVEDICPSSLLPPHSTEPNGELSLFPDREVWQNTTWDIFPAVPEVLPGPEIPSLAYSHGSPELTSMSPATVALHQVSSSFRLMSQSILTEADQLLSDTEFLNKCLNMFFMRFIPTMPAVHKAGNSSAEYDQLLLLSMMALGSLFVAEDDLTFSKGETLWSLVQATIATPAMSMCNTLSRRSMMTVVFLGRSYEIITGKIGLQQSPCHSAFAVALDWANDHNLLNAACHHTSIPDSTDSATDTDKLWKSWVSEEVLRRSILGYYILDGLLSELSGNPTTVDHVRNPLPVLADDTLFNATTADEWLTTLQEQHNSDDSLYTFKDMYEDLFSGISILKPQPYSTIRVVLEGIQSCIRKSRTTDNTVSEAMLRRALVGLRSHHITNLPYSERLEHSIRWHVICINLITNPAHIRTQLSFHSHEPSHTKDWLESPEARYVLLHSAAIFSLCRQVPFGRSHCMHIPLALFTAASIYTISLSSLVSSHGLECLWIPSPTRWDVLIRDKRALEALAEEPEILDFLNLPLQHLSSHKDAVNLRQTIISIQGFLQQLSIHFKLSRDMSRIIEQWIVSIPKANDGLGLNGTDLVPHQFFVLA